MILFLQPVVTISWNVWPQCVCLYELRFGHGLCMLSNTLFTRNRIIINYTDSVINRKINVVILGAISMYNFLLLNSKVRSSFDKHALFWTMTFHTNQQYTLLTFISILSQCSISLEVHIHNVYVVDRAITCLINQPIMLIFISSNEIIVCKGPYIFDKLHILLKAYSSCASIETYRIFQDHTGMRNGWKFQDNYQKPWFSGIIHRSDPWALISVHYDLTRLGKSLPILVHSPRN